ncbi:Zinc finger, CCHC domain-containing protein [Actinomortierella ambigua]|nr:Zinc finger, CCHC domain-containing protein [Actinomortierella ambigua]
MSAFHGDTRSKYSKRELFQLLVEVILFEHANMINPKKGCDTYTIFFEDLTDDIGYVSQLLCDYDDDEGRHAALSRYIRRTGLDREETLYQYYKSSLNGNFRLFPHRTRIVIQSDTTASGWSELSDSEDNNEQDPALQDSPLTTPSASPTRSNSIVPKAIEIPALTSAEIQDFLWDYAYINEDYQDILALLVFHLRQEQWVSPGSGGTSTADGKVTKYTQGHNLNKIATLEKQNQEAVSMAELALQKEQEAYEREQYELKESEERARIDLVDRYIRKLHKSHALTEERYSIIEDQRYMLERKISQRLSYAYVRVAYIGSVEFALATNESEVDVMLQCPSRKISMEDLEVILKEEGYEDLAIFPASEIHPTLIRLKEPTSGLTFIMCLDSPLRLMNTELISHYAEIDPDRFKPILMAAKQLARRHHILAGPETLLIESRMQEEPSSPRSNESEHDGDEEEEAGPTTGFFLTSYALTWMVITFLQSTSPPVLPNLQAPESGRKREAMVDGYDCSFVRTLPGDQFAVAANKNRQSAGELFLAMCRFYGEEFDYIHQQVAVRLGGFRSKLSQHLSIYQQQTSQPSSPQIPRSPSPYPPSPTLSSQSTSQSRDQQHYHHHHNQISLTLPVHRNTSFKKKKRHSGYYEDGCPSPQPNEQDPHALALQVMDPFETHKNVTETCTGRRVRYLQQTFGSAYNSLLYGDINSVFNASE